MQLAQKATTRTALDPELSSAAYPYKHTQCQKGHLGEYSQRESTRVTVSWICADCKVTAA